MRRSILWLLLLATLLLSLMSVVLPFIWISPFRPQTTAILQRGYALRHAAPFITLPCAFIAIVLAALLWKKVRRVGHAISVFMLAIVFLAAWLARQNYYEWFFHPLAHPGYVSAEKVDFVKDSDMVLAVRIDGEAAAYPVRLLAYHHVVNDTVGGTPVVATY